MEESWHCNFKLSRSMQSHDSSNVEKHYSGWLNSVNLRGIGLLQGLVKYIYPLQISHFQYCYISLCLMNSGELIPVFFLFIKDYFFFPYFFSLLTASAGQYTDITSKSNTNTAAPKTNYSHTLLLQSPNLLLAMLFVMISYWKWVDIDNDICDEIL